MKLLVLSSSRGTTFQAVIDAMKSESLSMSCLGLISDRSDRGCVEKAKAVGLSVSIVEKQTGESREDYDARLHAAMIQMGADPSDTVIAALGWMFIFSPDFIRKWRHRIINVHPALLPDHGGKGMYGTKVHEAVLASGKQESGITIHLMDENVDTGPVLLQRKCPVLPDDTIETLKDRVQALEKEWYPKVLEMIERGELQMP
jgi:phosphoribosylglycinamide formyltransferase-1